MSMSEYAVKFAAPARWILILGIVVTVINTARNLIYLPESPATTSTQTKATTAAASASGTVDVNALANLHLFGRPTREGGAVPRSVANAQATRLPLELKAVFAASENAFSAAIIGQRGQRARLYTVGESVPGNAVLAEVYPQQVLLRRAGQLESLAFPESTYKASSKSATQVAENPAVTAPNNSPNLPSRASVKSRVAESADTLTQQIAADPQAAIGELGLTADSSGGYKVGDVANSPYFQSSGLKRGDIIFSINGSPMSNVKNDKVLLAEIMSSGRARLEVMRNNQRFVITASIPTPR
tara:strand:+ start:1595 stop:2491 length:897 start_codon:yes stop_codon:yes gene_type:complete